MTTKTRAPIEFKAKIKERYCYHTALFSDAPVVVREIKVPAIKRHHCDMHVFRCESHKYGALANSDLFPAALRRGLAECGIGEYIRLDTLPECVQVDDSGFLALVSINLPLD